MSFLVSLGYVLPGVLLSVCRHACKMDCLVKKKILILAMCSVSWTLRAYKVNLASQLDLPVK